LVLQKAFDTVSHDILLAKLEHYGIRGPANLLMKSLLTRKQYTSINGFTSGTKEITYEVAQGSILGPLLFLLYINDLPNSTDYLPRLYVDDTYLVVSSHNCAILETRLIEEIMF